MEFAHNKFIIIIIIIIIIINLRDERSYVCFKIN